MSDKMTKIETARALLNNSDRDRLQGLIVSDRQERIRLLTVQLYNAASAYQIWMDSEASHDYDAAMEFSTNLERAADAYAAR